MNIFRRLKKQLKGKRNKKVEAGKEGKINSEIQSQLDLSE